MSSETHKMGYAFATKLVAEQGRRVRFMYREYPDGPDDSGWHFFCGEEDQAYTDNPDNSGTYPVSTIAKIDPSIVPVLQTPPPCAFEREDDDSPFMESDFDSWPEE